MDKKQIIVIGGGAAGFFAAINTAERLKSAQVIILEKSNKLLSKVKISGGGRCNVTNFCLDTNELVKNYPRGGKELKQVFARFQVQDTINWFEKRSVKLKKEADERMFPFSDNSQTIIDCFLKEVERLGIEVRLNEEVLKIEKLPNSWLNVQTDKNLRYECCAVICSTGGHNRLKNYNFIQELGHKIITPLPSLFTINLPNSNIKELMGLSVKSALVKVAGLKHKYAGPVLITHWGLSGPAVLKLSAYAAEDFFAMNYEADILINWLSDLSEEEIKNEIEKNRFAIYNSLFGLPKRLWEYFLIKAEIPLQKSGNELSKKQINKLVQILINDNYSMQGKTTFKEEFVTCGGVDLKEVDFKTMQSKIIPGLYFCGEVLNIDGITGGFNFQSAWSTAAVAAMNVV